RLHSEFGGTTHVGRISLIDIAVEADQSRNYVLIADLCIMLMRSGGVPPRHLQLGRDSRINAEPAGPAGHAIEPSHVQSSGLRIVVRIRCPSLVCPHHIPGRPEVSECSKTEAMPHHAKRSGQESEPIVAVVSGPGVTLAAPDRDRIERHALRSPSHGPILPYQMRVKED